MAMIESKHRATSDPAARKDVLKRIKDDKVEYVLFWFTDLEGHLKSFAITPGEIETALDDGMGFDGSSITGFNAIEESDMVAIPDPDTFRVMPARAGESVVGRMICDVVKPDGTPYEGDPRFMLRKAIERMQSMGFDTFNIGPELEYFLFKDNKGTETLDEGGYFAMTALDAATELRNETIQALESVGIPIEYHHHEVAPSQHEIDMRYAPALEMADATNRGPRMTPAAWLLALPVRGYRLVFSPGSATAAVTSRPARPMRWRRWSGTARSAADGWRSAGIRALPSVGRLGHRQRAAAMIDAAVMSEATVRAVKTWWSLTRALIRVPTVNPPGDNYREICDYRGPAGRRGFATEFVRAEGTPGDSDRYPRWNLVARREGGRPGRCVHFNSISTWSRSGRAGRSIRSAAR